MTRYFGGMEGGSTGSTLVVTDENGKAKATVTGPSTNYLLIGKEQCFSNLKAMIDEAKTIIGLPLEEQLETLGLCLSGCLFEEECSQLAKEFTQYYPNAAKFCNCANDTVGSIHASGCQNGILIICGTGSNSILFKKTEVVATCGGWGHLLGDEGSAYWIAQRAYKTLLDDNDRYKPCKYNTDRLRHLIRTHYQIKNENLIYSFYQRNDKRWFASLCKELYAATRKENDEAINDIFRQAGAAICQKIVALLSSSEKEFLEGEEDGLSVIVVGNVFNSWDLLRDGFITQIPEDLRGKFNVYRLTSSSAFGAARFGAKLAGVDLKIEQTKELLYKGHPN